MSEQVSNELLKIMNDIVEYESTIFKIDSSIFVRSSEKIINDKIAYLYSILQAEASSYSQKQEKFYDNIELIIAHYKQKLNMVYDEFYCEYANILNEINETRLKKNANMINYQAIINQIEVAQEKSKYLEKNKQKLKEKNEIYNQIIDKCNKKFESCKKEFEQKINDEFLVISSLQVIDEINIFKKLARKILNIFTGNEKYLSALDEYSKKVDKIDAREIVNQMREETIDFVEEILTLRDFDEDNLADVG
jgi:hypothetical protein